MKATTTEDGAAGERTVLRRTGRRLLILREVAMFFQLFPFQWVDEASDSFEASNSKEVGFMEMISFSVDPQWCGLLFSIYWRHEKGFLLGGSTFPQHDAFAACSFLGPPADTDWIALAGSVGIEICRISSSWALIFDTGEQLVILYWKNNRVTSNTLSPFFATAKCPKATGVILLLGFGSIVCYKVFRHCWQNCFSTKSPPDSPTTSSSIISTAVSDIHLLEDLDNIDLDDVEASGVKYFGANTLPPDKSLSDTIKRSNHVTQTPSSISAKLQQLLRDHVLSAGLSWPSTIESKSHLKKTANKDKYPVSKRKEENTKYLRFDPHGSGVDTYFDNQSTGISHTQDFFSLSLDPPQLARDEIFDSLSCSRHITRNGSFDSASSEFSLDFSIPESLSDANIVNMEKIQKEIDSLNSKFLEMDEEIETIKSNRNLPGMSSLMEANTPRRKPLGLNEDLPQDMEITETLKQQNARACFAGLYSLTTIKNSASSDLSDSLSTSIHKQGSVGSTESLVWDSPKILGYAEIPSMFGFQHLRRIRGDNYCGVRAAIFQTLSQGHLVPGGSATFEHLSRAVNNNNCGWLKNWKFASRLPYQRNNVLYGMKACLQSLDNLISLLSSERNREEALVNILTSDPLLDLHIMEAVKLHMLHRAMELHQANSNGYDVPLFAVLMFSRDTSETPKDFMNNHLSEVGNSGGLEQIEMYLVGYTLGVTLTVVRPSAFGTDDFVCSYPDWNQGIWPQVFLVAEDDRHYNVLVE
uniref:Uncharacterized protein n=1 Tax=Timema shepardi TaxID=629360 RepID=A0A7R9AVT4_TIMSH|nr:unnamed protein product [Timema shepardi]